ncbi:MAG: hypothetical protein L0241_24000 [Planctomycetia bacterium]|nr:hypothetical protein [Planctomycetia bacterium]
MNRCRALGSLGVVLSFAFWLPLSNSAPPKLAEGVAPAQAPPPRLKYPPTDPSSLWLQVRITSPYGPVGDEFFKGDFEVYLGNKTDTVREIHEMLAPNNQLLKTTELSFVARFENGNTVEFQGRVMKRWRENGDRPITLPASGSIVDKDTLSDLSNGYFADEAKQCKKFAIAVIIRPLKLASEYDGVNGFVPPKDADPLKDADDYHIRKRAEREWKKFLAEEKERLRWWNGWPP